MQIFVQHLHLDLKYFNSSLAEMLVFYRSVKSNRVKTVALSPSAFNLSKSVFLFLLGEKSMFDLILGNIRKITSWFLKMYMLAIGGGKEL